MAIWEALPASRTEWQNSHSRRLPRECSTVSRQIRKWLEFVGLSGACPFAIPSTQDTINGPKRNCASLSHAETTEKYQPVNYSVPSLGPGKVPNTGWIRLLAKSPSSGPRRRAQVIGVAESRLLLLWITCGKELFGPCTLEISPKSGEQFSSQQTLSV